VYRHLRVVILLYLKVLFSTIAILLHAQRLMECIVMQERYQKVSVDLSTRMVFMYFQSVIESE
jgi:hypothetical protein